VSRLLTTNVELPQLCLPAANYSHHTIFTTKCHGDKVNAGLYPVGRWVYVDRISQLPFHSSTSSKSMPVTADICSGLCTVNHACVLWRKRLSVSRLLRVIRKMLQENRRGPHTHFTSFRAAPACQNSAGKFWHLLSYHFLPQRFYDVGSRAINKPAAETGAKIEQGQVPLAVYSQFPAVSHGTISHIC
jgi:hypothetical protein